MFHRRLFSEILGNRILLIGSVLLSVLAAGLTIGNAFFLSQVINRVFLGEESLIQVADLILGLVLINLLKGLSLLGADSFAHRLASRVQKSFRKQLIQKLFLLGPSFVEESSAAHSSNVVIDQVDSLEKYFSEYVPQILKSLLIPLMILFIVFPEDLLTGIILLVTAPLIPFFMVLIGRRTQALNQEQWEKLSRLSQHFLDVIQGMRTLKDLGRSREQADSVESSSNQYAEKSIAVVRVAFLSALTLELLATLSTAVIAVEIGLRLLGGNMQFASALFLLILAPEFYLPLRNLGLRFHAGAEGIAAAKDIYEILDQPVENPIGIKSGKGIQEISSISISQLSFHYPDRQQAALHKVNFELKQGESLGLIGPNGSGKSTLVKLLLGFLEPNEGEIFINGKGLGRMDRSAWQRSISWVPQFPSLFKGTIADNISLSKSGTSSKEIERAAECAGMNPFVDKRKLGFDWGLAEDGKNLSGGQAQRIALARAFLRNTPMVIMDEANTHLDPELALEIQDRIAKLIEGRISIVIAHRLSSLKQFDKILALRAGRQIYFGEPAKLGEALKKNKSAGAGFLEGNLS